MLVTYLELIWAHRVQPELRSWGVKTTAAVVFTPEPWHKDLLLWREKSLSQRLLNRQKVWKLKKNNAHACPCIGKNMFDWQSPNILLSFIFFLLFFSVNVYGWRNTNNSVESSQICHYNHSVVKRKLFYIKMCSEKKCVIFTSNSK